MGTQTVKFTCLGLAFVAEVEFEPYVRGVYSGPPERCYPDEGGTAEIVALTCDGQNADFLLASDEIREQLEDAAYAECEDDAKSARDEAECDAYEARQEEAWI